MPLTGRMCIGQTTEFGTDGEFQAVNPGTGAALDPVFGGADPGAISRACEAARAAFDLYRKTTPEARATFLETISEQIVECGDALISRAMEETGLPRLRLEGERARTVGQLKLFASVVREGSFVEARIDTAMPERRPLPRADLRMRHIALGPVAVFAASNFPFAFSVAGGDTASALAAGCPVVVKAHEGHPVTSDVTAGIVAGALASAGAPAGTFGLVHGVQAGLRLLRHPAVAAAGFTGSTAGGLALARIAAERPVPIPFYGELGSVNPCVVLPGAALPRPAQVATGYVGSLA